MAIQVLAARAMLERRTIFRRLFFFSLYLSSASRGLLHGVRFKLSTHFCCCFGFNLFLFFVFCKWKLESILQSRNPVICLFISIQFSLSLFFTLFSHFCVALASTLVRWLFHIRIWLCELNFLQLQYGCCFFRGPLRTCPIPHIQCCSWASMWQINGCM